MYIVKGDLLFVETLYCRNNHELTVLQQMEKTEVILLYSVLTGYIMSANAMIQ